MRRLIRVLGLVASGIAFLLVAGMLVPRPLWRGAEAAGVEGPHRILVISNPIHTDIAVPASAAVLARFGFLREHGLAVEHSGVRWLLFGWGGRSFYLETPTWGDLKLAPVVRALTIDSSVMHVGLAGDIPMQHPSVIAVDLQPRNFGRLLDRIGGSFTRDADGQVLPIPGKSYGPNDRFYEAEGSFNALVGCNIWTAATLRAAGLRSGWWTPLPWLLELSLRLHNSGLPLVRK